MKENNGVVEFLITKMRYKEIGAPDDAQVKNQKSETANYQVLLPINSPNMIDYIAQNVEYALDTYSSKASSFGCCSMFMECSDAKRCVHENKLYSKACAYRRNLEAGKIFYGKNKTI